MPVISAPRLFGLRRLMRVALHLTIFCFLSWLVWSLSTVSAAAQDADVSCGPSVYDTCTQTGSSVAGGIILGDHCVQEVGRRTCVDNTPLNECAAVEQSFKCQPDGSECIDWVNGECRQTRHTYSCLNQNGDMSPADLVATRFGPVQEDIINFCEEMEVRADHDICTLQSSDIVEGSEVRDINRKLFAREWWRQRRTYSCISDTQVDNTCGPLESNPSCELQGSSCLVEDANGTCTDREYHYRCGSETEELATSCEPINVCVGELCFGVEEEENTSFGDSAAWLNVLAEMQKDFSGSPTDDPNEVQFFTGERLTCSIAPGRNCCAQEGFLEALVLCPESADYLAEKRAAEHTHYVGTSCSVKVLGKCLKKRKHFCTYNSKFSRVFMEQYKVEAPEEWGDTHGADCSGVTIEDVANVDVDEMDFSEVVGDISDDLTITLSDEISDFFDDRWPNVDDDAQDVFQQLEEN